MKQRKHTLYYFSLVVILALGVIAIMQVANKQLQILFVAFMTAFYIGWGILHHALNHSISAKIVVEYVLIGCLAMALLLYISQIGKII